MPIKIAIDVSPLTDGNSRRGVGFYTRNLVSALNTEIEKNHHYQIDLIQNSSAKLQGYDLVHYPYFDPFYLTLPRQDKVPFVVTVHDLIPIQFPHQFPVGIKGHLKWLVQKSLIKKATLLLTVSHTSKYAITDILHYPADKIYVTHLAAASHFHPIKNLSQLTPIKTKYHLPDKFVLFVGDINTNKNIPSLVKACIELDYALVIVGDSVKKSIPSHPWTIDLRWVQQCSYPKLILPGFVPDDDLNSIYNLATVYCQPSFAEGFGIPLVEAMQAGCPVAYSQESSLPEIVDFNGLFFDPYSISQLKSVLQKFWSSETLRQKFIKLGLKRAKDFSWQITAKQTLAIYQTAIDIHGQ